MERQKTLPVRYGHILVDAGYRIDLLVDGLVIIEVKFGAPRADDGPLSLGIVYVYYGPLRGDHELAAADLRLVGEDVADGAGTSTAGAGDVDGDGAPDLAIGAPGAEGTGAAYLVGGGSL